MAANLNLSIVLNAAGNWCDYLDANDREDEIDPIEAAITALQPLAAGTIESAGDLLTEAYHTIYDVKDASDDEPIRYGAYLACQKVALLMAQMGLEPPSRHDGEGRPDTTTSQIGPA